MASDEKAYEACKAAISENNFVQHQAIACSARGSHQGRRGRRAPGGVDCSARGGSLAESGRVLEMSAPKRSMRHHEKGLAALWAVLIGIITLSAIRLRFTEWLKQGKSK
jgi:hypothetical protein